MENETQHRYSTRRCPFQMNIHKLKWWSTYRLVNQHRNSSEWEMFYDKPKKTVSRTKTEEMSYDHVAAIVSCGFVWHRRENSKNGKSVTNKSNRLYTFLRRLAYIKNWYKECCAMDAFRFAVSENVVVVVIFAECTMYVTGNENLTLMMWCALSHLSPSNISKLFCMHLEREKETHCSGFWHYIKYRAILSAFLVKNRHGYDNCVIY